MRFRPVLFVGLGRYGCDIARGIAETIRVANAETAPLVALLQLDDDGALVHEGAEVAKLSFTDCDTYEARFAAIASEEQSLSRTFVNILDGLRRKEVLLELEEKSYRVDPQISIYFVTPLCDDIGSVAVVALIGVVGSVAANRLKGQELRRTVLGFFPDLLADFRDVDDRYARTYVCLQELEFIAGGRAREQVSPYDQIDLFTGKNEENEDISSHEELALALGETLNLVLRHEIAGDTSFASALVRRAEDDIVTRFSSLGTSKLVLPRDAVCRALDGNFAATVLEDIGVGRDALVDRHIASVDVRKFIDDTHLKDVEQQMEINRAGSRIRVPFTTSVNRKMVISARPEEILEAVRADAEVYERATVPAMTRDIRERRMELADVHRESLRGLVHGLVDLSFSGLRKAEAFMDVFLNRQGAVTTGDVVDNAVTIDDVDVNARKFFDELLGIRRGRLAGLQQEITSKRLALAQHEETLAADEAPPATSRPETKTLQAVVDALKKELEELEKQFTVLKQTVQTHDLQMQDGAYRRSLLQRRRVQAESDAAALPSELEAADGDLRSRRSHLGQEVARTKRIVRNHILGLCGIAGLYLIGLLIGLNAFPASVVGLNRAALYIVAVWVIVFAVSGARAYVRLQAARSDVATAESRKLAVVEQIRQHHEKAGQTVYHFTLHGAALDWSTEFRRFGDLLRNDLDDFRSALEKLHDEERAAYTELSLPQTLLRRAVVNREDVKEFLDGAPLYDAYRKKVRAAKPLSHDFKAFIAVRNAGSLLARLREASADVFAKVRTLSIEQFLASRESAGRLKLAEKLQQLFRFGAPLVRLHVERGDDHSDSVRYLGLPQGSESPLFEQTQALGYQAQAFQSATDTEITVVTMKVGFPAYHVALVIHCDHVLQSGRDAKSFQVVPEWPLEPLMPSQLMLGGEDDMSRQLACQALALGIVQKTEGGIALDGTVIGPSYRGLVETLRSLRGAGLKARLQVRTSSGLQEEGAADKLSDYLTTADCDTIDQRIIQRALDRLDESS